MIQEAHLQVFDLELTTRSPLSVGNGRVYQRMEYMYDRKNRTVFFLDETAFVEMLMKKDLVDKYERFILGGANHLFDFLCYDCGLNNRELANITRCTIRADHLGPNPYLRQIHAFSRNAQNQAFIPGSSLKGALRTAILTERILNDSRERRSLVNGEIPESQYLNTLHCHLDKAGHISSNAVNSIMRGISVSDSAVISDSQMTLTDKIDVFTDGSEHTLPIYRECVVPKTKIRFILTLDQSILKGSISRESLLRSIACFDDYYQNTYPVHFAPPEGEVVESYGSYLILGAGAGYFSKTVTYPYLGDRALSDVSHMMSRQFWKHHHEQDMELGISPRTMKYAEYNGRTIPYGVCEVALL